MVFTYIFFKSKCRIKNVRRNAILNWLTKYTNKYKIYI